ncbi:AAA family ATPase [Weissella cibaria]|uniref:AAA family ATPase n=1 Tax=Weissella cibaria TaxID=137591 RepID=UPI0014309FC4|nr:AAA family ATPase [Weissella cibaria]MCQ9619249.1 AAA family ATPase [Weissella cibaria]
MATDISSFISTVLNAALAADESTIKQSFTIEVVDDGFIFVLRYPNSLIMNTDLYFRIYDIVAAAVYPAYTLIRPASMQLVAREGNLSVSRGLFFPWKEGRSKRLIGSVDDILANSHDKNRIPIMQGIDFDFNKSPGIALTGNSGAGKSTALHYLLEVYAERFGTTSITLIDPKLSNGARWAKNHDGVNLVIPQPEDRPEDFLPRVNATLADAVREITRRQSELYQHVNTVSADYRSIGLKPRFIVIDEVASLAIGLKKSLLDEFHGLLTQISLLGRESGVFLTLSLQEARQSLLPTEVRSQMGVRILLGRIDKQSAQFLFPEMDSSFPLPIGGRGTGIISINDGEHYGVEPVAMPTITTNQ